MFREAIEKELYDAVSKGNATKIQQLLQQDPYLVESVSFPCSRSLLHIATLWGQVAIVDEVLNMSPQLARNLDSQKLSPLHIAAAQGNVEIATKLLSVAPEMCWCRDDQGLNPVHVAAMNGHVKILEALLEEDQMPAMERVHRGQTVLHLCVKHRQLMALEFLVENYLRDLGYAKDDDGETLLHWAVRIKDVEDEAARSKRVKDEAAWSKRVKMVDYLVENFTKIKESTNSMGNTAYEIFIIKTGLSVEKYGDSDKAIRRILEPPGLCFWSRPAMLEVLTKKREQTMVVMTLIATMAFQAAVSPPGGVWQDDTSSHRAGEAVMASTHSKIYKHFIRANSTAFISSLITIFMVAVQERIGKGFLLVFSSSVMWISLASIAVSYGGSVLVISPNTQTESLAKIINAVVAVSVSFLGIALLWCISKPWRTKLMERLRKKLEECEADSDVDP